MRPERANELRSEGGKGKSKKGANMKGRKEEKGKKGTKKRRPLGLICFTQSCKNANTLQRVQGSAGTTSINRPKEVSVGDVMDSSGISLFTSVIRLMLHI